MARSDLFSCAKDILISDLVGGFNPFEKYARQIGSFPQVGVKKQMCETTTL